MLNPPSSTFAVGTVYCIPYGDDRWVVAQASADGASIGMFDEVIGPVELAGLRKLKQTAPDFGAIRLRQMFIKQAPSRGNWLRIGVRPLNSSLTSFMKHGMIRPYAGPNGTPLFEHLSDDWTTTIKVAEESYGDLEHSAFQHDDGLWRWMTGEPVFKGVIEQEAWRTAKRREIRQIRPEVYQLMQKLIPLMLLEADEFEAHPTDPRFMVPKNNP